MLSDKIPTNNEPPVRLYVPFPPAVPTLFAVVHFKNLNQFGDDCVFGHDTCFFINSLMIEKYITFGKNTDNLTISPIGFYLSFAETPCLSAF